MSGNIDSDIRVCSFWGRVPNLKQSQARKKCFQASDRLKFATLPRKYRTLSVFISVYPVVEVLRTNHDES